MNSIRLYLPENGITKIFHWNMLGEELQAEILAELGLDYEIDRPDCETD